MKKSLNPVLALILGLLGGLASRYIAPPAVFAQNRPPRIFPATEIRAQSFTLVDGNNHVVGKFTYDAVHQRVSLHDANEHEIWSAGGSPLRLLGEK